MSEAGSTPKRMWRYRFSQPGEVEIETAEFADDDSAEARARELSQTGQVPVVIHRRGYADWDYITEVDERR